MVALPETWHGDNPYFLVIAPEAAEPEVIDLDEPGWLTSYATLLRMPALWHLARKDAGALVFSMAVLDGEQPYYVGRHIGIIGSGGGAEIIAYGIGKKRLDGHVDRLWVLPNGQVVPGDDIELFARQLILGKGPQPA